MLKTRRLLFCATFLLFLTGSEQTLAKDSTTFAKAHALMQEFYDKSNTPGLAISVGLGDKIIWSEGFGYADIEQMVVVDPARTSFRIGSVIKSMTAFAVAQLVEAGSLDLDEPIQTYVPGFPRKESPITTRMLLGHMAGIRHYAEGEFFSRTHYETVTAGLTIFQDDPLVFMPGEAYVYSSYGYNLISAAIEGVTGQQYLAYMSANVFNPLGMSSTVPDFLEHIIPGRGRYYYQANGKVLNTPEVDNSYKWASGGFVGTSEDLVRFGLAQLDHSLIGENTRKVFWTEQSTMSGEKTGYGLGWRIATDERDQQWIGHGGGSVGGTTQLWIKPENGLVFAMISNMSDFDYGKILVSLEEIFSSGSL
jgi:serine beta-lactamase-like protein LACTB